MYSGNRGNGCVDEVLSRLRSGGYDVMGSLVPLLHTARYSVHAETLVVELMAQLIEQGQFM